MATPVNPPSALATLFPTFTGLFSRGRGGGAALPSQATPLMQRVSRALSRNLGGGSRAGASATSPQDHIPGKNDSLAGTPSTALPSVAGFNRLAQVYDRRAIIRDLWELYYTDPTMKRAVWKRARAAVAGGFDFRATPKDGTAPRVAKRAQQEIDALLQRTGIVGVDGTPDTDVMASWLIQGLVTGDLFQQRVFQAGEDGALRITQLLTMPSESMERNTDNADQFTDPSAAFLQLDVASQQTVARFSLAQIYHGRWERLGSDRYGNPDFVASRDTLRNLQTLERAQGVRRMTHAAQKEEHSVGDSANPSDWADVEKYMKLNGQGDQAAMIAADPYQQVNKYFHNGRVGITFHDGDPSLHEIADLEYFREGMGLALDMPLPLLGLALGTASRDTLDFLHKTWIESLTPEAGFVWKALWAAIVTQLVLVGINPASLNLTLAPRYLTLETPQDRANFVKTLSQNTVGAGMAAKPFPLGTPELWMSILAKDLGVTDPKVAVDEIRDFLEEFHIDPDTMHAQQQAMSVTKPGAMGAPVGAANSKNSGNATTGYGERFEGGKSKQSTDRAPGEGYKK